MRKDPNGQSWIAALVITAIVVAISGCSSKSSGPYSGAANCYAYALNLENDPNTNKPFTESPQPGSFSGNPLDNSKIMDAHKTGGVGAVEALIMSRVEADCANLGYYVRKVDSADYVSISDGWTIALAYQTGGTYDYHFFKKQTEPIWSHKPGLDSVMHWDFSHGAITDPNDCNRGKYNQFVGYYEIAPNVLP